MTLLIRAAVLSMSLLILSAMPQATFAMTEEQKNHTYLGDAAYDGKWSGIVKCLYDPGLWPEDECDVEFTFEINGNSIIVEQIVRSKSGKETKSTINPGRFKFARLTTNAIAVSIDSGKDEDGTWVETWSFAMTLSDPDHMIVHWTRIVNNIDIPLKKKGSKFSSVGMGELTRKSSSQ